MGIVVQVCPYFRHTKFRHTTKSSSFADVNTASFGGDGGIYCMVADDV